MPDNKDKMRQDEKKSARPDEHKTGDRKEVRQASPGTHQGGRDDKREPQRPDQRK